MPEPLVYRRSTGSRMLSSVVLVGTGGLLVLFLLGDRGATPVPTWILVGSFFAVSLWLTVANFGDRIEVEEHGIRMRNLLTESLGGSPTYVAWEEIIGLREHRKRALFLIREQGRAIVLDHIGGHEELARIVQERTHISLPPPRDTLRDRMRRF